MAKFSPFQETTSIDFGGLVTEEHLGRMGQIDVQKADAMVTTILQKNVGESLDTFLNQFGIEYFDSDDDFRWMLQADTARNIALLGAEINGTAVVASDKTGLNQADFVLKFPEPYFFETNLIQGRQQERYPILCISRTQSGSEWHYTCRLNSSDPKLFIPYEELQAGLKFAKMFSPVERTLSQKGGGVNYTSPFAMINTFNYIRLEDVRPGNLIKKAVVFPWLSIDGNGKKTLHKTWMQYADWTLMKELKADKARLLMSATTNRNPQDGTYNVKGYSGHVLKTGAGIRQQMDQSNQFYYNTFDINWLEDILLDMCVNRRNINDRNFVLNTGERGKVKFHRSLEGYSAQYVPNQTSDRIYKSGGNELGYKGQFGELKSLNGINITLRTEPMYDDDVTNIFEHPEGGVAASYRFDIMDFGTSMGEANIKKCMSKEFPSDIFAASPGLRSPYDVKANAGFNLAVSGIDGYKIYMMSMCGARIKDPTRTGGFIPNILADTGVVY